MPLTAPKQICVGCFMFFLWFFFISLSGHLCLQAPTNNCSQYVYISNRSELSVVYEATSKKLLRKLLIWRSIFLLFLFFCMKIKKISRGVCLCTCSTSAKPVQSQWFPCVPKMLSNVLSHQVGWCEVTVLLTCAPARKHTILSFTLISHLLINSPSYLQASPANLISQRDIPPLFMPGHWGGGRQNQAGLTRFNPMLQSLISIRCLHQLLLLL